MCSKKKIIQTLVQREMCLAMLKHPEFFKTLKKKVYFRLYYLSLRLQFAGESIKKETALTHWATVQVYESWNCVRNSWLNIDSTGKLQS